MGKSIWAESIATSNLRVTRPMAQSRSNGALALHDKTDCSKRVRFAFVRTHLAG